MTKRKTIITVVAAFIAVCAAGALFLFLHMDVHAGLLMYGGQSQVTIKPANDTHANTFTATINGHTVSETETYLYNESSAGDIVITPAHGYRFKNVSLETDQGAIYVWNSDTPCTQEDLDQEKYDATIETSFTSVDLRNLFFAKNPDGSYNYNGALTLSKSFLATDPHVGW